MADGIDLDQYVKETLLAIVGGVLEAQRHVMCGDYIGRAPATEASHLEIARDGDGNIIALVKFDLATTVEEKRGGKAGGSIKVVPFLQLAGEGGLEAAASTVSRLQFSVPVSVPKPLAQKAEDEVRESQKMASARIDGLI